MEAIIQKIIIYDDGLIELIAICNNCKHTNYHTITHASEKKNNKVTIDFSKLGKRCCDNNKKIKNTKAHVCWADYKLYT